MMQQPPMPSVRAWLESIGLAQYAELFEQQAIDFDLLCELTEADLQKLGIAMLGHRLRLIKAITVLSGKPSARHKVRASCSIPFRSSARLVRIR